MRNGIDGFREEYLPAMGLSGDERVSGGAARPPMTERRLDPEHVQQLLSAQTVALGARFSRRALRRLSATIGDVLHVKAAFVRKRGDDWLAFAQSCGEPRLPLRTADIWRTFDILLQQSHGDLAVWTETGTTWTVLEVSTPDAPMALLVEGDWTASAPMLQQLVRNLLATEASAMLSADRRTAVAAQRLSRVLGRVTGVNDVCATVLRHAVRMVPSRIGAFAVPGETGRLSIVATHGYSPALVQDLRIAPGAGVIGSVYASRVALRVDDARRLSIGRRRSRYRTNSFLAVPSTASGETLGVLCLADRVDGATYSRADLAAVQALLAPAALALARESARRQAQAFQHAATIDPVSGLFNRRYFQARLAEELERAQRHNMPVALLMVDVDDFKQINDRFGHVAGDTVIRDMSDILRRSVRVFDVCTRYGGEEFAILMPGSRGDSAASIAERIRHRMEAYRPDQPELSSLRVTASIGLAMAAGVSTRELIDRADRALYTAKTTGKNRVVRADDPRTP
jgi:diguanylate cyclase (GGDEF)-like protein